MGAGTCTPSVRPEGVERTAVREGTGVGLSGLDVWGARPQRDWVRGFRQCSGREGLE